MSRAWLPRLERRTLVVALAGALAGAILARLFGKWLPIPETIVLPFGALLGLLVAAVQERNLAEARAGLEIGYLGEMMVGGAAGGLLGALPGFIGGILGGIANGVMQGSLVALVLALGFGLLFSVFPSAAFGVLVGAAVGALHRALEGVWPPAETAPSREGYPRWPFVLMGVLSLLVLLGTTLQSGLRSCGWLDISLQRGACRYQFGGGGEQVARSLSFDATGDSLRAVDSAGRMRRWALADGRLDETVSVALDGIEVVSALASGDGILYLGTDDSLVRAVDGGSGEVLQSFRGHETPPTSLALSPDRQLLASGANDRTIRLWNPAAGDSLAVLEGHEAGIVNLAFSADGGLLASAGLDGTARVWRMPAGAPLHTLAGHDGAVRDVAFLPDGSQLLSVGSDGTVRWWRVEDGALLATVPAHEGAARAIAIGPDGVPATAGDDSAIRLWPHNQEVQLGVVAAPASRLAFSADGRYLASATTDGAVQVWELP